MKKLLIISIFILAIILASTVGYKVVSANTKIDEVEDIITYQEKKEDYLTYYNYTLENPNILLDPYGISPLTALIIFETETEEEVSITIQGKDENSTYTNKFQKEKIHYIPVLGLYPNYDNKVTIECGNIIKTYTIKTSPLPDDLQITNTEKNNTNNLYFISSNNYTYAIDSNNDVRWYLTTNYLQKISLLKNGHFLLSNNLQTDNEYPTNLVEIDLLGKIYTEYNIGEPYYGSYAETDHSFLVLSESLLEIDKQSGKITRKINLDAKYSTVSYDSVKEEIILTNNTDILEINYKTENTQNYQNTTIKNENIIILPLYNMTNYKLYKSNKFTNNIETQESDKNIFLLNYQKPDSEYNSHNINIEKETERLVIKINLDKTEKAYIILDKFLGKKVYDLKNGYNCINKTGLSGDYSIYIKINKKTYKTDNYVTF